MNSSIVNESEIVNNKPLVKKTNKKNGKINVEQSQSTIIETVLALVDSTLIANKEKVVKEKVVKEKVVKEKIVNESTEEEKVAKLKLKTAVLEAKNTEKLAKKESLAFASTVSKQAKKNAVILENEIEYPDIDLDLTPEVKQLFDNVLLFAYTILNEMYEKGKDLNGIHLKVFSSESLESFLKKVIEYCFTLMGIENGKICQDYLSDSENILDDQKFDQHIYINNKIVLMHENHACVDKSFYTQKRGVIQDIMKLPFCTEKLHTNVKFVILSYASEVTNKTKITQDKTKGFEDITKDFSINGYRRGIFKNWYEGGFNKKNVKQYIKFIVTHLIKFK